MSPIRSKLFSVSTLVLALAVSACGRSTAPLAPGSIEPLSGIIPGPSPTVVPIDGSFISFTLELSRDFMPPAPPNGLPLTAFVVVETTDDSAVPGDLEALLVRVKFGDEVWEAPLVAVPAAPGSDRQHWIAQGGPLWPTGSAVTARMDFRKAGRLFSIPARNVLIIRTS